MGCIVSCLGCLCCKTCKACGSGCSKVSPTAGYTTRLPYLMFMFLGVIIAMALREWGAETLLDIYFWDFQVCTTDACVGNQAILRMSFAMVLFFSTFYLMMCSVSSAAIHNSCWLGKAIYFIGLIIVSFILPDSMFQNYAYVAMVGGGMFLLLQVILLIDIGYRWNSSWVEKDTKVFYGLIVCFSLIIFGFALALWILMFSYFRGDGSEGCQLQEFIIVMLILLGVASILLSISNFAEHGALLTACVVVGYCTFLANNGLKSDPSSCNTLSDLAAGDSTTSKVIGIMIATVSIVYSSWSLSNKQENIFGGDTDDEERVNYYEDVPASSADADDDLPPPTETEELLLTEEVVATNRLFHLLMVLASMYMGMLLTGWSADISDSSESVFALSTSAFWVNIICHWLAFALYIWTLIAPKICSGREF